MRRRRCRLLWAATISARESSSRSYPAPLTIPQRLGRLDSEDTPGRADHRQQGDHHHERRCDGDDAWDVQTACLFDRQVVVKNERRHDACARPDPDLAQRSSEDSRQQAAGLRPKGRPDPDLPAGAG